MKQIVFLFVFFVHLSLISAQHGSVASATVTFEFPSKKVKGSIEGFESQSKIDWVNPSNSIFKGSVEAATLDTNNGLRNWSLRSSRYFDAKTHPKIVFSSAKVQKTASAWLVQGDLTIKGITKPFEIEFEEIDGKLVGKGELYCSDFDIKIKKERTDNLVKVKFEMKLIR